ncbi:Apolipophorin-3 [Eumeta japonica]|uniref:Apolipophorin-3 n=1 Tax=Eumeta variegata TaxID=151549 RepID=A0A4C1YA33_EUMVA|nr:Apolipophorin-3 [Eumeta japonica]
MGNGIVTDHMRYVYLILEYIAVIAQCLTVLSSSPKDTRFEFRPPAHLQTREKVIRTYLLLCTEARGHGRSEPGRRITLYLRGPSGKFLHGVSRVRSRAGAVGSSRTIDKAAVTESAHDSAPSTLCRFKGGTGPAPGIARRRARRSPRTLAAARPHAVRRTHDDPLRAADARRLLPSSCKYEAQAYVVKRDAPNVLEDVQRHAQEFQKTFTEQLNSLVNSKNTQEFNNALREGSDSVLQQLSALSSSLQSALSDANGRAKQALEETRTNIERQAEELRRTHPEVERQSEELRGKLQQAVTNTVAQTQKLAEEVHKNMEETGQKLAPQIKEAYDSFVRQAQEVQQRLHEAANKQ